MMNAEVTVLESLDARFLSNLESLREPEGSR
jgi:hypothetical protein